MDGARARAARGRGSASGRPLAEALHARGARLVLAGIDADALSATAARLGATGVLADVSVPAAMSAVAARAPQARLICLNAGVVGNRPGGGAYGPSKHAVTAIVQHAAMALAGTPVRVSMICPALVATGMSPEGTDPALVARDALQALDDGVFAVVPSEWQAAVVAQAGQMVSGHVPTPPAPK